MVISLRQLCNFLCNEESPRNKKEIEFVLIGLETVVDAIHMLFFSQVPQASGTFLKHHIVRTFVKLDASGLAKTDRRVFDLDFES